MACASIYTVGETGVPSELQPELVKEFKEFATMELYQEIETALKAGLFGSRKLSAIGEPSVAQVKELIGLGLLNRPTAVMVNGDEMDRLVEVNTNSLRLVNARIKNFKDVNGTGPLRDISEKEKRETYALQERLQNLDKLDAYLALVQFADKQMRDFRNFLQHTFNAKEAATGNNENQHSAAIDQMIMQLANYDNVFQPQLAKDKSVLQQLIVGGNGADGLQKQKEDLLKMLQEAQMELILEQSKLFNNREGLTDEQIRADFQAGLDVMPLTKALGGATQSSSKGLSLIATIVDSSKMRSLFKAQDLGKVIAVADKALQKAGVKDFGFMLGLGKDGLADGTYVQKISRAYYEQKNKYNQARQAAGAYYEGKGLSNEQKLHNLEVSRVRKEDRDFRNAETIDEEGNVSDGVNHQYTPEFKAERAKFEELRQDGKRWNWERKGGLLGYANEQLAQDAYESYLAKYYTPIISYQTLVKERNADGQRVTTGEVEQRTGRFTKEQTTTQVREENHRSTRYAGLLADKSEAGKAKLDYYNFFSENLDKFIRVLPKADTQHLKRGELPAVIAAMLGRYNSKSEGYLDYMGKVISNPLKMLKEMLPAATAGKDSVVIKKVNADGTRVQDAPTKFTGRFRNQERIDSLKAKLDGLDEKSASYKTDKDSLEERMTIEENRPAPQQVETDLSRLLHLFGAMAQNYQELKEQEGTINLLRDSIKNRTFYEEKDGKAVLGPDGLPVRKPDTYSSQISKQTEDWLAQNYFQDDGLGKSKTEQWARRIKQYGSTLLQGANYAAAIKNVIAGNLANRIYAAGKIFGWDKKVADKALAEVMRQGASIAADNMAERMEKVAGLTIHPKKSKIDAILSNYAMLEHESKLVGSGVFSQLAFFGMTVGEYHIQSQIAVAKLMVTMLTGKDGEVKNAYDAMSLVNGKLHLDPNFAQAWEDTKIRTVLDVRNIIKHTQGNHSDQDKVALEKEWMGAMALQFHRWVYNGFKSRWGRAQFDEGMGITTEGYYKGAIRLGKAFKEFGLRAEAYESLSEHDKALVRMTLQELKYVAITLSMLAMAGALKPDPDDDDMKFWYIMDNMAERVLGGLEGELTVFSDPLEVYQLAKNPVAGLGVVKDMGTAVKNTLLFPYYGLSGNEDKLTYHGGGHDGESKLVNSFLALTPIARMERIWDQAKTTGTNWVK